MKPPITTILSQHTLCYKADSYEVKQHQQLFLTTLRKSVHFQLLFQHTVGEKASTETWLTISVVMHTGHDKEQIIPSNCNSVSCNEMCSDTHLHFRWACIPKQKLCCFIVRVSVLVHLLDISLWMCKVEKPCSLNFSQLFSQKQKALLVQNRLFCCIQPLPPCFKICLFELLIIF